LIATNVARAAGAAARELRVAHAGRVAHARQQALRPLQSERVDQLLAQRGLGIGVHEPHAVLVQPDVAGLGAEMHLRAQIAGVAMRTAPLAGSRGGEAPAGVLRAGT
jgi:hypothetical protein